MCLLISNATMNLTSLCVQYIYIIWQQRRSLFAKSRNKEFYALLRKFFYFHIWIINLTFSDIHAIECKYSFALIGRIFRFDAPFKNRTFFRSLLLLLLWHTIHVITSAWDDCGVLMLEMTPFLCFFLREIESSFCSSLHSCQKKDKEKRVRNVSANTR